MSSFLVSVSMLHSAALSSGLKTHIAQHATFTEVDCIEVSWECVRVPFKFIHFTTM